MKIGLFSLSQISIGKHNIKDSRLDQVDSITKSKKKTYVQVELVGEDSLVYCQAILAQKESAADLILKDLEFIETRLSRSEEEEEKLLLNKLKAVLEKEELICNAGLTDKEKQLMSGYSLLTDKPVVLATNEEIEEPNALLVRVIQEAGFISFFTTGEKETRAWLIKKGVTAWEAAGAIHSDIQRGFIRAEIISFDDFIQAGGENQAKQAGKLRLETKNYIMQDTDLANFRFNK
jgi:ribosome-binding ATPase YchF (GTP1/OBG family)